MTKKNQHIHTDHTEYKKKQTKHKKRKYMIELQSQVANVLFKISIGVRGSLTMMKRTLRARSPTAERACFTPSSLCVAVYKNIRWEIQNYWYFPF